MALTKQQQFFAAGVAQGMPGEKAAVAAGYSAKSANSYASQLISNPKVAAEIERMRSKLEVVALGSKAELLNMLWTEIGKAIAEGDRINVTRMGELWLKARGELVAKHDIKTDQVIDLAWAAPVEIDEAEPCE